VVEPDRPPMTIIRRMRLVCWITRYRHPHAICNTCCFSTATMVTRTRQCYVICILPGLIFVFNTKTRSIFSFTCCRGMSNNAPLFSVTYIIKTTALTQEIFRSPSTEYRIRQVLRMIFSNARLQSFIQQALQCAGS
jgi:hypothetical protein